MMQSVFSSPLRENQCIYGVIKVLTLKCTKVQLGNSPFSAHLREREDPVIHFAYLLNIYISWVKKELYLFYLQYRFFGFFYLIPTRMCIKFATYLHRKRANFSIIEYVFLSFGANVLLVTKFVPNSTTRGGSLGIHFYKVGAN